MSALLAVLLSLITPIHARPRVPSFACDRGSQLFASVCLPDRMVAYIVCLDHVGNGRLRITTEEDRKTGTHIVLELAGRAAPIRGVLGVGHDEENIRKVAQELSPQAIPACLTASSATNPAEPRKRDVTTAAS